MDQTFQHSLVFSHDDDQAETCGRPMPLMTMMTGICDRPKTCNDDEHERKGPTDGPPSPWKHGWTLNHQSNPHDSWSWTRPRSLDGTAHPLFVRCHVSKYGVWGSPGDWRLSDPCALLLRSPLRDLWRSDPSELGRPATETLEATDFLGSRDLEGRTADFSTSVAFDPELVAVLARLDLDDPSLLARLEGSWRTSSGACISTELSMVSRSWDFFASFAAAAALRRFFCSLALACAFQASGSQSLQMSQGESSVHKVSPSLSRHCWQQKWLSLRLRKLVHPGNFSWDSAEDDRSRDLESAILSTQVRLDTET